MAFGQYDMIQPAPEYWKTNFLAEDKFAVPMGTSNEVVEINLNDLPETDEILDLLKSEKAPIKMWNIIALHYLVRKREDVFCAILELARQFATKEHKDTNVDEAFCMDLLANYYAVESSKERADKDKKKELFNRATLLYNQVDKLFVYSQYHLVGRAYFCMFDPEKMDQAATQFEFVLHSDPTDQLALQGRGIVAFQKGDYKKALICFKKVLSTHPGCSADIRMAIGHCLFKLTRYDKAKVAYERTLELDPLSVGAMVGLALILNNEGSTQSVQEAMRLIVKVYNIDKTHPINLNLLADHFFYRKEPEKAINLSSVAIQTSTSEMLKAESAYMLGRSHHYREDYEQAFQFYYQATQFAKQNFVLPWYGLGQMYIQREEHSNAIQCFEKVLAGSPNNVETLKLLGLMYLKVGSKEKKTLAKNYLKKVTELCPDDIDAHIKFAELQEVLDPQASLNTYLRVLEIYRDRSSKDNTPPELLNNISVLYFNLGNIETSRKFLELAKSRAEEERSNNEVHYGSILITMAYNQGRLAEAARDFEEAERCFKQILRQHQNYVDCFLRLGCLCRDRGSILSASDWFKEAGSMSPDQPDSHLLLGNLHMQKGEYAPAQKKYEKILNNPKTKNDTYAMLSLANIWLETLYSPLDPERKKRHSERAFTLYRQVLKIDPSNVYAVNGMGAILAKAGQLEEAKEMFSVVRESTADILDVWLNIGHSYCDQKQHLPAMRMYENALKRFKEAALDPVVFLYLARAQYFKGDLKDARRTLQLARRLAPHNQSLRYNLGVVMKRMAVTTLKDFRANLRDVMGAIEDLKSAQTIFEFLSTEGDKSSVDLVRAGREAKTCSDYLNQSAYHLERAKEVDVEEQKQRQKIEEARITYQKRMLDENQVQMEAKLKQQEELTKKREEILQRTMMVKESIVKQEAGETDSKPRKRPRKVAQMDDGFIDDAMGMGGEGRNADAEPRRKRQRGADDPERRSKKSHHRKRREQKRKEQDGDAASSGDDHVDKPRGRKTQVDESGRGKKGRVLSKAYISDTDSSTTDEDAPPKGSQASGSDLDDGLGKLALESSDEEGGKSKEKAKVPVADSDEESDKDESPRKPAKRALSSSDEEGQGTAHFADLDDVGIPEPDDDADAPPKVKMSMNESDSE